MPNSFKIGAGRKEIGTMLRENSKKVLTSSVTL